MLGNRSGRTEALPVRSLRIRCLVVLGVLALLFGASAYVGREGPILWLGAAGSLGILLFALLGLEPILARLAGAQGAAREDEQHMRAVLDAAAEGILTLNADGTIAATCRTKRSASVCRCSSTRST